MIPVKLSIIYLCVLAVVNLSSQIEPSPIIETSTGKIRGYRKEYLFENKKCLYTSYEGIPYAKPPVGDLRFEPPVPVEKWSHVLAATKKGSICTQYLMNPDENGDRVVGREDCLYLNIYRPDSNATLPVMVLYHPGAYQFGSGNQMMENYFMCSGIVLVTVNYRLGPLGFLSTEDDVVPGNMGLKDQSVALRWVSKNIEQFGGNPRNVTIFGSSAGGSSVHYHYLSPWSAGLFQQGISISGVALSPWTQTEGSLEKAKELGAMLHCPTNSTAEMISCLKKCSPRLISQMTARFQYWLYNPFTPFGPVVEKHGSNPFIDRPPIEIIESGNAQDVPWMSGVVSEEGLYPTAQFIADDARLEQLDEEWHKIAPHLLDFNYTIPLDEHKQVSERIRQHYLGSQPINNETVMAVVYMVGDRMFVVDYEKSVRLHAKLSKSPVWTYLYSYRALHSYSEVLTFNNNNYGVCNSDDLFLVTDAMQSNTNRTTDKQMQQLLVDLYTSFAITGTPRIRNTSWAALNPDDKTFKYLHIAGPNNYTIESNDNLAQKKFWNSINFNENKLPSDDQ